jgi:hypothetical protein
VPTFDELSAKVAELTSQVSFLQSTLNPVDETGLPLPTSKKRDRADKHYGRTDIEGPRWQVDTSWTVIAMEDPDDASLRLHSRPLRAADRGRVQHVRRSSHPSCWRIARSCPLQHRRTNSAAFISHVVRSLPDLVALVR